MKKIIILMALGLLLTPVTGLRAAAEIIYSDTLLTTYGQILNPDNSLGEPDDAYADYMAQNSYLELSFEQTDLTSDVILHYNLLNYGASATVTFYDSEGYIVYDHGDTLPLGDSLTIEYFGEEPYEYIRVNSNNDVTWRLDAVSTSVTMGEEESEEEESEEEESEEEEEGEGEESEDSIIEQGDLIKLPDDGDKNTTYDSAVYTIGADGKRHAFPNETVFYSWYKSFEDVQEVEQSVMDEYSLGANVTMRPGTYLVKIQTANSVYAVEHNGILREIDSETIAEDLYGEEWAGFVRDVADVFWANYEIGDDLASAVHPDGTLLVAPSGEIVYLNNGVYYGLPGDTYNQMRFQSTYQVPASEDIFEMYVDGGDLTPLNYMLFPY